MKIVPHSTKHYFHLVMINALFAVICIPTLGKTVDFFYIPVTISIFYFPLIFVTSDLLTEVYGYALARRALWYSIIAQVITVIIFQVVAWYPPSVTSSNNHCFVEILSQAPLFVVVGTIALFVGDVSNNHVLSKMKIITKGSGMGSRFVISTCVGELLNTAIFYFFALVITGIIPLSSAVHSIAFGTIVKVGIEILALPMSVRLANALKRTENLDVFDDDVDFNPLRF